MTDDPREWSAPFPEPPPSSPINVALLALSTLAILLEGDPDAVFVQGLEIPCTCGETTCEPLRLVDYLDTFKTGIREALTMLTPTMMREGARLETVIASAVGYGRAMDADGIHATVSLELMLESGQLLQGAIANPAIIGAIASGLSDGYASALEAMSAPLADPHVSRETPTDETGS